jgi:hypothetical protein
MLSENFHPFQLALRDSCRFVDKLSVFVGSINDLPGPGRKNETILPLFIPGRAIFKPGTISSSSMPVQG